MTARPCVTAPAGDEAVQNEAVRATRLSEYEMAVPGRRGPVRSTALGPEGLSMGGMGSIFALVLGRPNHPKGLHFECCLV